MLTRKEILNRLKIYKLKGVNKEIEQGIVLPIRAGFEALEDREMFVLNKLYISQNPMTVREIAKYLQVSPATVYRIRNRALDILTLVIDDEYIEYNKI